MDCYTYPKPELCILSTALHWDFSSFFSTKHWYLPWPWPENLSAGAWSKTYLFMELHKLWISVGLVYFQNFTSDLYLFYLSAPVCIVLCILALSNSASETWVYDFILYLFHRFLLLKTHSVFFLRPTFTCSF